MLTCDHGVAHETIANYFELFSRNSLRAKCTAGLWNGGLKGSDEYQIEVDYLHLFV